MKTTIFSDGASRGNPGPGGWGAIVVESIGSEAEAIVTELGGREDRTTNNRMELAAVCAALEHVSGTACNVVTDSAYVMNGATKWIKGWIKRDWTTSLGEPVLNRDLWERFIDASDGKELAWMLAKGHADVPGNERCDAIATTFADGKPTDLFHGTLASYGIELLRDGVPYVPKPTGSSSSKPKKARRDGPAYSYLSMVGGVIETHRTWDECKARTHGVAGARFKKAMDAAEQASISEEWKRE
jgi:ribonuclease HI